MSAPVRIALVAGEASGDLLGSRLIEALRRRDVPLLGVAFIGDETADSQRTISEMGKVRVLGRLPRLDPLTPETLAAAMRASFNAADFGGGQS